ncbi:MAG: efflux RND transporter periplasmic adaptor subunit [Pseudomonadota bacterium]
MNNHSSASSKKNRVLWIAILGVGLTIAILAGIKFFQIKTLIGSGEFAMPPTVVSAIEAHHAEWDIVSATVGQLEAKQGVILSAETAGKVTGIHFESGDLVEAGQVLVTQNTSVEKAQLKSAQAALKNARTSLERSEKLLAQGSIPQSTFDSSDETYKLAQANAESIQAQIDNKTITAPFSGQLGVRLINLGEVIDAMTPLVTLQDSSSLLVNFLVPQQSLSKVQLGQEISVFSGKISKDNPATFATITAISPEVNAITRNVSVQGTLTNSEDKRWRPGMFVDIEVLLAKKQQRVIIPVTAVVYAPYGDSVYLIEDAPVKTGKNTENDSASENAQSQPPKKILRQVFVRLGEQRGDFVAVQSGIKPGNTIVSTGIFKLRNGTEVVIDNKHAPKFELNPTPADT